MKLYEQIIAEGEKWVINCHKNISQGKDCGTPIKAEYGSDIKNEDPWCAAFISVLFKSVPWWKYLQKDPFPKTKSTSAMLQDAKAKGIKIDNKPAKGSVFYYSRGPGIGHVGLVKELIYGLKNSIPDGVIGFWSIEGNTSVDEKTGVIAVKEHNLKDKDFKFIHYEELSNLDVPSNQKIFETLGLATTIVGGYFVWKNFYKNGKKDFRKMKNDFSRKKIHL